MAISNYNRSWILLIPLIPSILVSIFNLYHFLTKRTLRIVLNNHTIILLLIYGLIEGLTDIPWQSHYYRTGTALISTNVFCYIWVYISSTAYVSVFILMAWTSIERHILIFHQNLLTTKTKRFFFHYLPTILCILGPVIFYFIIFFILPCNISINYNRRYCSLFSCVANNSITALWDSIAHYIIPAFITVIFSVALFIRVIYARYYIYQRIQWRNYKKMALQLLPISVLFILLQFPPISLYAAYSAGLSRTIAADYYADSLFFTYWVILFIPFVCAMSLPDLKTKCRNVILFWHKRNAVEPIMLKMMTRSKVGQIDATMPRVQ